MGLTVVGDGAGNTFLIGREGEEIEEGEAMTLEGAVEWVLCIKPLAYETDQSRRAHLVAVAAMSSQKTVGGPFRPIVDKGMLSSDLGRQGRFACLCTSGFLCAVDHDSRRRGKRGANLVHPEIFEQINQHAPTSLSKHWLQRRIARLSWQSLCERFGCSIECAGKHDPPRFLA